MAPPLAVAADVLPASASPHGHPDPRMPSQAKAERIRRQRSLASPSHAERQQLSPNLASWLRSPSKRVRSDISAPTPASARRQTDPASAQRSRFRSRSVFEKKVLSSDVQMERALSLPGPSQLARSPSNSDVQPPTPSTSGMSASPTTPTTPSIPTTPPKLAVSQSISSPSLYQYGGFSYNGVVYSTPHHPSARPRDRSSTWSSVGSSYSYSPTPSKLPIGQTNGLWPGADANTYIPVDFGPDTESEYEYFDDSDGYEDDSSPWLPEADVSLSEFGQASPEASPQPRLHDSPDASPLLFYQSSPDCSPRQLRRPSRVPSGPRPMLPAPPPAVISDNAGLGLAAASESSLSIYSQESAPRDPGVSRRERRRGIDFMSNERFSAAFSISSGEFVGVSELQAQDEAEISDGQRERETSNGTIMEEDFSWEAQEYDTSGEVAESPPGDTACIQVSTSPARSARSRSSSSPPSDSHGSCSVGGTTVTQSSEETECCQALEDPLDAESVQPREVSAFSDSDEDADPHKPKRRRLKLKRLSKAMKSSVSLPSFKSRNSYVAPPDPPTTASPESVTSLRARQDTDTSLVIDAHILHLATGDATLSPIPASPSEPELSVCDFSSAAPEAPAPVPAPSPSPPTPATPISQDHHAGSFLRAWMSRTGKSPAGPPSAKKLSPAGRPPSMPLPPTPDSPLSQRVARPAKSQDPSEAEPAADMHLTVVDPDSSMARLQESMAKLEAYGPVRAMAEEGTSSGKSSEKSASPTPTKPESSRADGPANDAQVLTPSKSDAKPPKPQSLKMNGYANDVQVFSLAVPQYNQFSRYSTASTSTSGPSSSGSTSERPFVVEVLQPSEAVVLDDKLARSAIPKGVDMQQLKPKRPQRAPSIALLPKFDFEDSVVSPNDFFGIPRRTSSIIAHNKAVTDTVLPVHSDTVCVGSHEEFHSPSVSLPNLAPALEIVEEDRAERPQLPRRPAPPPSLNLHEMEDEELEPPSFIHFSPPPPQRERASRVRRLLKQVNVRGEQVRGEIMRGLRGSFVPLGAGY